MILPWWIPGTPINRNLNPLTAPMKLRESSQDWWSEEISYPLWDYAQRDDISKSEKFVATTAALLTTAFNPSALTITHMTSARGRHMKKYAAHYMASAADKAFYKHYLKRPLVPLTAKIASRAVPVLGWALLIYDFYTLATKGKFMGFQVRQVGT